MLEIIKTLLPFAWACLILFFVNDIFCEILNRGERKMTEKEYYHSLHTTLENFVRSVEKKSAI